MKSEPALIVGTIQAALFALALFGIHVSSEDSESIIKGIMALLPIVAAIIVRSHVTPVK